MIRNYVLHLAARFGHNHNLNIVRLSSSVSASTLYHATPSPSAEPVHITQNCVLRMKELEASESSIDEKMLRLSVETGGCSGFQYIFNLDNRINSDDKVFEREGVKLVVDNISYDFVKGATVDYVEELIRSAFVERIDLQIRQTCSSSNVYMKSASEEDMAVYHYTFVTENPSAVGGCSCRSSFMVKQ